MGKKITKLLTPGQGYSDTALTKLAGSGLTAADAVQLGIGYLPHSATAALHNSFENIESLKFNYYLPDGSPLTTWPMHPAFYRIRYLTATRPEHDLPHEEKKSKSKPRRYMQPPDTGVAAYFPQLTDWVPVLDDTRQPIIFTEGELKAACASKHGFPTIGLGGVHNFQSTKRGYLFLPELDAIDWAGRHVYIIFDSDYRTNDMVCHAMNTLGRRLMERGAYPYAVSLPQLEKDQKTGLDDFLCSEGNDAAQLRLLLAQAVLLTCIRGLWDLNRQVVYVMNPGLVVVEATNHSMSPSAFKEHHFVNVSYTETSFTKDGDMKIKQANAPAEWLAWALRRQADKLTYAPGRGKFFAERKTDLKLFNTWQGWGCDPVRGDTKIFHKLLDHLFSGAEPDAKQWFLRWCAYPLQHPGVKMFSSALIHGRKHGTGKSQIGYTLGKIYGDNFAEMGQEDLHTPFNSYADKKQFIMGDDISGSERRQDAAILRKMITQKTISINEKYVPTYKIPDCINYLWTSNLADAFFLEDDDRRFFIHEVMVSPLDEEFYVEYDLWLASGGAAHLFHELLALDLGDFNPAAPAFVTSAKSRMIHDAKSDLGSWVSQLLEAPDQVLRIGDLRLTQHMFSNKELLALYDPQGKTKVTANGLGRELKRSGAYQACDGKPLLVDGHQDRYYVVRDPARWQAAKPGEVIAHLEKHRGAATALPAKKPKY